MPPGRGGYFIPVAFDLNTALDSLKGLDAMTAKKGSEAANAFLRGLRQHFRSQTGANKEALARGLIDKQELRKLNNDAKREFNKGILAALKELEKQGKRNTAEFHRLQNALKSVGRTGGRNIRTGLMQSLSNLPGLIRGSLAGGMIASFTYIANQVVRIFQRVGTAIKGFIQEAGDLQILRQAFEELAATRGLDTVATLEEMRRVTRGLVSDMELFRTANLALQSGLPVSIDTLGELAEMGRRLGRSTGRDAAEGTERLVKAIVKAEVELLDELGLYSRLEPVLKEYGRLHGVEADRLDQATKTRIFMNAVLDEARAKMQALGEETLSASERMQQAATFVTNLRQAIQEAVVESPRLAQWLDTIGTNAEDSAERIHDLANQVGALVDTALPLVEIFAKIAFFTGKALVPDSFLEAARFLGIDLGPSYEENLAQRRQQDTLVEQIKANEDIIYLRAQQQANLERILEIMRDTGEESNAEIRRLLEQNTAIETRVRDLNLTEIRHQTEIGELNARKERNLERINALQEEGLALIEEQDRIQRAQELRKDVSELTPRELRPLFPADVQKAIAQLDVLNAAITERINELTDTPEVDEAAARRLAETRARIIEQITDRVRNLTLSATQEARHALKELEQEFIAAGGVITDEIHEMFRLLHEDAELGGILADFKDQLADLRTAAPSHDTLRAHARLTEEIRLQRDALEEGSDRWEDYNDLLEQARERTEAIKAESLIADIRAPFEKRQEELQFALAAGIMDEDQFKDQGEKAAEAFNAGLIGKIKELKAAGEFDLASQLLGFVEKIESPGQRRKREQEEELRLLRERAQAIEETARGAIQLAEGLGLIDDEASKLLQSIAQGASALVRVVGSIKAEGPFDYAAAGLAAGAFATLASSVFGESPEDAARRKAIEDNSEQLRRLTLELEGFTLSFDRAQSAAEILRAGARLTLDRGPSSAREVTTDIALRAFEQAGISRAQLEAIARDQGITIFDEEGNLMRQGLLQLADALDIAVEAMTGFVDSVEGQRERFDLEAEIFDRDVTAQDRLQFELGLLQQRGGLGGGLDASTPQGRAAIEEFSRRLFEEFAAGTLDLGGLDREQFLEILRNIDGALDELGDTAADGSVVEGFRIDRSITEVTATRMVGTLTTIDARAAERNRLLQMIATAMYSVAGFEAPTFEAPRPGYLLLPPGGSAGGGPTNITVEQIGPFEFSGAPTKEAAAGLGSAAAKGFVSTLSGIDRGLGDRNISFNRSRGATAK